MIDANDASGSSGTPAALRAHNRRRVLEILLARIDTGMTHAELGEAAGLSRPSVASILKTFEPILGDGPAAEANGTEAPRRRGRLGAMHCIDPTVAWTAAVDIGRNHIYVGVADLRGAGGEIRNLVDASPGFEIRRSPLLALEHAADILNRLLDEHSELDIAHLAGIVVSLPGPIGGNRPRDRILDWGERDVAEAMRETLRSSSSRWRNRDAGLKIMVDNDANLSAVAEHSWGAGRGCADIFYIKWSTGLGGGVILDGELRRGTGGAAGEFAHTPVPSEHRDAVAECDLCHNRCFESAIGFGPLLEKRGWSYREVQAIARDESNREHLELKEWIEPRAEMLGLALVPIVNTLNPELIVVDGILDRDMEGLFARRILRSLEANGALAAACSDVRVRGGNFTDSAAARGGLTLAHQAFIPDFLLEMSPEGKELSKVPS